MKKQIILSILLVFVTRFVFCQCDVQVTHRSDGTISHYTNPVQVGNGTKCQVGISVQTNGRDFFLNTIVRYFTTPKKVQGTLKIKLENGDALELKLYKSEIATLTSDYVSLNIFYLSNNDLSTLRKSPIELMIFTESDGLFQIIKATLNNNAAMEQINCLLKV